VLRPGLWKIFNFLFQQWEKVLPCVEPEPGQQKLLEIANAASVPSVNGCSAFIAGFSMVPRALPEAPKCLFS